MLRSIMVRPFLGRRLVLVPKYVCQELLSGYPYSLVVDVEIAVRHAVAHATHLTPGNLWVVFSDIRVAVQDSGGCLPHDYELHHDGILDEFVFQKLRQLHPFEVLLRPVAARRMWSR